MGQVTFTTTFSGGNGNLFVSFDEIDDKLHLTPANRTQTVSMPAGVDTYRVSGDSPDGTGGNIHLDITGDDIEAPIEQDFPSGLIDSQASTVIVTI